MAGGDDEFDRAFGKEIPSVQVPSWDVLTALGRRVETLANEVSSLRGELSRLTNEIHVNDRKLVKQIYDSSQHQSNKLDEMQNRVEALQIKSPTEDEWVILKIIIGAYGHRTWLTKAIRRGGIWVGSTIAGVVGVITILKFITDLWHNK